MSESISEHIQDIDDAREEMEEYLDSLEGSIRELTARAATLRKTWEGMSNPIAEVAEATGPEDVSAAALSGLPDVVSPLDAAVGEVDAILSRMASDSACAIDIRDDLLDIAESLAAEAEDIDDGMEETDYEGDGEDGDE